MFSLWFNSSILWLHLSTVEVKGTLFVVLIAQKITLQIQQRHFFPGNSPQTVWTATEQTVYNFLSTKVNKTWVN